MPTHTETLTQCACARCAFRDSFVPDVSEERRKESEEYRFLSQNKPKKSRTDAIQCLDLTS